MAILKIIFRKMLNNKWLTGSLFLGILITVSLVSSIPTYTDSVMQKLLVKELEDYQIEKQAYPGQFSFTDTFSSPTVKEPAKSLKEVEEMTEKVVADTNIPLTTQAHIFATIPLDVAFKEQRRTNVTQRPGRLLTLTNLEDHIRITDGHYPNPDNHHEVIEVLMSEQALFKRKIVLGTNMIVHVGKEKKVIKPVGTYVPKEDSYTYWSLINSSFTEDFIVNEQWFRSEIMEQNEELLGVGNFSYAFDFYKIKASDFHTLFQLDQEIEKRVHEIKKSTIFFDYPIKNIVRSYEKKSKQMTTMLWSLNVPILIMLAIYLFMISKLIIERQLNEIAIFVSRGASRLQILFIYFIEILVLGLLAFIIGPLIGLQLCKILGATNGFLEFVQRSSMAIELTNKAYIYASLTVVLSIIMIMIPVYQATTKNIVNRKQSTVRMNIHSKWYFILFELILLSVSLYSLFVFNRRQKEILKLDIDHTELMVDPLLFFMPALFIISLGLLFLRLYPFILKGVFLLGKKYWSLSLYSTFLQVSRSTSQYKFLMIFLMVTIGTGVFSASAARTINTNLEEQILYENGADVRVGLKWESNAPPITLGMPTNQRMDEESTSTSGMEGVLSEIYAGEGEKIIFTEPPFEPIVELPSVEQATKVMEKNNIVLKKDKRTVNQSSLMAIEPKKFGEVSWFKNNLLPYHWYNYLNLLSHEPSSVLISMKVAEQLKVGQGDHITIVWHNGEVGEMVVHEVIEYWPTFNPLQTGEGTSDGALVVANLPYIQNVFGIEPYDIWIKMKADALRADLYAQLEETKLPIVSMNDMQPEIVKLKNSALLLGVNGMMTLGFIISLLISFIGFVIYWVLTIKSRMVQYGIYRAMGLEFRNILVLLGSEQILTSGIACLLGVVIGGITSQIFVPLFKLSMNIKELMPPFTVVFDPSDERKIYFFVSFMLLIGLTILFVFIKRMKIDQAIKLGED